MEIFSKRERILTLGALSSIIGIIIFAIIFAAAYKFPPRKFVSERVLRSGMATENSICYRKPVAVGSILECRNRIVWDNGEEEIVDLPFPLFGGERIEIIEKIIHIPCLPSLRETYLKYNGGRRL